MIDEYKLATESLEAHAGHCFFRKLESHFLNIREYIKKSALCRELAEDRQEEVPSRNSFRLLVKVECIKPKKQDCGLLIRDLPEIETDGLSRRYSA